jgi:UPF0042 nucleotide-binding protein
MSGSGKSTAIRALEDAGFFCVDNLPVLLLPKLTELAGLGSQALNLGLVIDAREGVFLHEAPRAIAEARMAGHQVEVLFLDSNDDALARRFSETRRRHPLAPQGSSVAEGIQRERIALKDLRALADQVMDTSELNVHDLKKLIHSRFSPNPSEGPSTSLVSFGYRYGVPPQADLVFDVRFLPNPYFVPELKGLTGRHPEVARYVLDRADSRAFLDKVVDLCRFLMPRYQKEGKAYLTVALGCTGGKHRSVAMARELYQRLSAENLLVQLWDRDVDKE